MKGVSEGLQNVYEIIVRRFLSIFYPAAEYQKISIVSKIGRESFFTSDKRLIKEGYLNILKYSFSKKSDEKTLEDNPEEFVKTPEDFDQVIKNIKKGTGAFCYRYEY